MVHVFLTKVLNSFFIMLFLSKGLSRDDKLSALVPLRRSMCANKNSVLQKFMGLFFC